jgi:ribose 5-phosphate isomerase B
MRIFIGADHRGFELKEKIKQFLHEHKIHFQDVGAFELDPNDDYPFYAQKVAEDVSDDIELGKTSRGIVICGSGVGVDIVANKFKGIRCGLGISAGQIASARRDDDINILAIAADETNDGVAMDMVTAFLDTLFEDAERRVRRLEEIKDIENQS